MPSENPASPRFERAAICGVGLLGASLGLALRERGMAGHVVGVGRDQTRLEQAAEKGALDSWTTRLEEGCACADLIVLCGPVSIILEQLPAVMSIAPAGALITDVGSTKHSIVRRAEESARPGVCFVGSHPMAGSEKSGAAYAKTDLYEGATVILTPNAATDPRALAVTRGLWSGVGMRVVEMPPDRHDRLLAQLSHLPHLVAAALAALSEKGGDAPSELVHAVAGPGFRDTTRIAMGGVAMWLDIFLDNRAAMLESLDQTVSLLSELRTHIAERNDQALARFLEHASNLRKAFEKGE